jgi:glutamyl-tRNA synthetase
VKELIQRVQPFIEAKGYPMNDLGLLEKAIVSLRERVKTLVEMADQGEFYFSQEIAYDEKAAEKFLRVETKELFEQMVDSLSRETILNKEKGHQLIQQLAEARGEPLVKIAQPLRVALTGKTVSPPIDEVIDALGKEEVIRRLEKAMEHIQENNQSPNINYQINSNTQ